METGMKFLRRPVTTLKDNKRLGRWDRLDVYLSDCERAWKTANDPLFVSFVSYGNKAKYLWRLPTTQTTGSDSQWPRYSNRHLEQDDAFNRTWWSVFSIDKLVTWQHLSIERTDGHVVLKASSCLRSLMTVKDRQRHLATGNDYMEARVKKRWHLILHVTDHHATSKLHLSH